MDMFRRLSEALPLSEASLLAMRPALNAPVLNFDFLPVGPARAAIAVFAEEWGGIGFALGIRSNGGGQIAVFRNQESIEPDVAIPDVLEPVLAEAERMGFLFDEDMLIADPPAMGRELAMELWGRLMGEVDMPASPRAVAAEPAATEPILDLPDRPAPRRSSGEELVLEEVAPALEIDLDLELELEVEEITLETAPKPEPQKKPRVQAKRERPAEKPTVKRRQADKTAALPAEEPETPVRVLPPSVPPERKLSKFRHADEPSVPPIPPSADINETTAGGSELGRIPIVQIRRQKGEGQRVSYVARLLSSF